MKFRVLVPLHNVPIGSTITKRGGEMEFIVHNVLRIYDEDGNKQEIPAGKGTRFLVPFTGGRGSASIVSTDLEVLWTTDFYTLEQLEEGYL